VQTSRQKIKGRSALRRILPSFSGLPAVENETSRGQKVDNRSIAFPHIALESAPLVPNYRASFDIYQAYFQEFNGTNACDF
jgi:hypothetical protein